MSESVVLIRRIRILLSIFIGGLVFSGITAFALQTELEILASWLGAAPQSMPESFSSFTFWIVKVRNGVLDTNAKYPFIAYGTDWLAFAHLVLAILFIGPLINPVKNVWVVTFGLICCVLVPPFAFIFGSIRGIPVYWQLIDSSFGVFGFIPLWFCKKWTLQLNGFSNAADSGAQTRH